MNGKREIITRFTCMAIVLAAVSFQTDCATVGRQPITASKQPSKTTTKGKNIMEPAFSSAGQQAGIEIWRIENFKPVAYTKNDYGKFYSGDSYIILNTKIAKDKRKSWNIHFWLGKDTTQDEAGAAAILTVQLDDQLGGDPVQYREVQEHESQTFLSYFKSGVRYLPGGVSSGFHHVDKDAFAKKLYQVKGKRNVRVKQVDLSIASMNKGDCFILEAGKNIYVYVGTKAKRVERLKAISAANLIRDQDHGGSSKIHIIDESATTDEVEEFFTTLGGGSPADVPEEHAGGDDEEFEKNEEKITTLYRVSDANGKMEVIKVATKPLQQSMLDTNDCFILAGSNIFVWIGKKCNKKERSESMSKGQQFLSDNKYPDWTQVVRVIEGGETSEFTQYFQGWRVTGEVNRRLIRSASGNIDGEPRLYHATLSPNGKIDLEEIMDYKQEDLVEDDVMVLDGISTVYVWVGKDADEDEREKTLKVVSMHLKKLGRFSSIVVVDQGDEGKLMTEMFPSWRKDMWQTSKSYEELKNDIVSN